MPHEGGSERRCGGESQADLQFRDGQAVFSQEPLCPNEALRRTPGPDSGIHMLLLAIW